MYHPVTINHTLKGNILQGIKETSRKVYFNKKKKEKHPLKDHFKCKIRNQKVTLSFKPQGIELKCKNQIGLIPYETIRDAKIKVKWWRIRVSLKCKKENYHFDLSDYSKAMRLYEELIYKKVQNSL